MTAQCPSIRYIITAKNCGVCPRSTTNTSIICSIFPHTRGKCMFAVRTEICRSVVGERSDYVVANRFGECMHALNVYLIPFSIIKYLI